MINRSVVVLLLLVLLLPCAFADIMGPAELLFLPGLLIAVPLINGFFNFAVMFFTQKFFLGSFFSKIPTKEILSVTVLITIAGWFLDGIAAAISILFKLGQILFGLDFFVYFLFLLIGQYLLLRKLNFGGKLEARTIAFALAVFTNPGWIQILLLSPSSGLSALVLFAAVAILGFILLAIQTIKRQTQPKEHKEDLKLIRNIVILFVYTILSVSIIFAFPDYFSHGMANIVCNSDDPAKILVKASQVSARPSAGETDFGTIKLVNLTGGNISNLTCTTVAPTGAFAGNTNDSLGCQASVASGAEFTLTPDELVTAITASASTITVNYNDYAGSARSATIACSGPITISES